MSALKQAKLFYNARKQWLGEGGMPSKKAQERADVCLRCPHNDASRPLEEAGKALLVRMTMEMKRKFDWKVKGEEGLHLCDRCDCLLKLKVFTPLEIARVNTPDWERLMPEWCWIKSEGKDDV